MRRYGACVVAVLGLPVSSLGGCQDDIDLDPLDDSPAIEARVRPKPIAGGTLVVADGVAVAADPDRDLVHIVDLGTRTLRHTIALEAGDEPGRVVLADGIAHVVLRGMGGIASIDVDAGTTLARRSVCGEPRGLAHDSTADSLHVACADGWLVELEAASDGAELSRTLLEPDLRDVVIVDGKPMVSTFRSAALIDPVGGRTSLPEQGNHRPHVAWRTVPGQTPGSMLVLHHLNDSLDVPTEPRPEDFEGGSSLPYGGGSDCQPGITGPALSLVDAEGVFTSAIANAPLAVDVALAQESGWVAVAMPGAPQGQRTMQLVPLGGGCIPDDERPEPSHPTVLAQVTSVAFTDEDTLVMFSREPAQLLIQPHLPDGGVDVIELEGEPRFDTGHEIFHRATESGLSCASCHPEGTDDGFVWRFEGLGPRRTQPLDIALAETAPFHWDGEMHDLDVLMSEVLAHRMGGKRQSSERAEAFRSWLFAQERPAARMAPDDAELVAEGEALFTSYACTKCHGGAELGGVTTEKFRDADLQVPSLRRVALRPPYMHDGRSLTLEGAVTDMIDATVPGTIDPHAVDALTAYLRTL